jgi:hypothetical protein
MIGQLFVHVFEQVPELEQVFVPEFEHFLLFEQ